MYASAKKTKVQLSKDIFPAEAWELISKNGESDDLVIIDVSTPQEYKDLHLEGAINVNLLSRFFKKMKNMMEMCFPPKTTDTKEDTELQKDQEGKTESTDERGCCI